MYGLDVVRITPEGSHPMTEEPVQSQRDVSGSAVTLWVCTKITMMQLQDSAPYY